MEIELLENVDTVMEALADERHETDATIAFVPYPSAYAKAEATVRCPM